MDELDRIIMPEKPLEILIQKIVPELSSPPMLSEQAFEGCDLGDLHALFATPYPYRELTRKRFDILMTILADGYPTREGRHGTHVHLNRLNNKVRACRGSNLIALTKGGAISDRYNYQVVLDLEDTVVGTPNEDFALDALPGDVFTLGIHSGQLLWVDALKVRIRDT